MARRHLISGLEDDRLASIAPVQDWTDEELARYVAAARAAQPTRRAAVVTTMRDDGIAILEWVACYRVQGFEGIFIYSNDNRDASPALLQSLAAAGVITYVENRTSGSVSPQRKAYGHSLRELPELRDYAWVLYVDSDEFLTLAPRYGGDIGRLLDHVQEEYGSTLPAAVFFHWKGYSSDFRYEREEGLLLQRFQHGSENRQFKSLVRLSEVGSMNPLHFPELTGPGFFVDSALRPVPGDAGVEATWQYLERGASTYAGGQVRHYWARSFQEFAIKKWRGDALRLENNPYKRDVRLFFEWNGLSTPDRFDPPDPDLVQRIREEMQRLRSLPGVGELDRALSDSFPDLLAPFGGDSELRTLYERAYREALEAPAERRGRRRRHILLLSALALLLLLLLLIL